MNQFQIKITLAAGNLGPYATEEDFGDWINFVNKNFRKVSKIKAEIDHFNFSGPYSSSEDKIEFTEYSPEDLTKHEIKEILQELWEEFCAKY